MSHDIAREVEKLADDLGVDRKRSIGEVAKELKVEPHVIRFWEEHFPQIKPEIGAGKRRYYYNKQLKILKKIKKFLYEDGYTVAGLQKLLKKRKHDDHKEEDLDMILTDDHEIDDFIDPNVNVEIGVNIDPQAKLMNFSKIKVWAIDPKMKSEIVEKIGNIREELQSFKNKLKT